MGLALSAVCSQSKLFFLFEGCLCRQAAVPCVDVGPADHGCPPPDHPEESEACVMMNKPTKEPGISAWKQIVARYQRPAIGRSTWQIVNTLVPYAILWYLMYRSLAISYWLTVPLVILAGAVLCRGFISFHD